MPYYERQPHLHVTVSFPEAKAALEAIQQARQDLEKEIQRRELKIQQQQNEVDKLRRELREVKQLERNELKKLKLVDTTSSAREFTS